MKRKIIIGSVAILLIGGIVGTVIVHNHTNKKNVIETETTETVPTDDVVEESSTEVLDVVENEPTELEEGSTEELEQEIMEEVEPETTVEKTDVVQNEPTSNSTTQPSGSTTQPTTNPSSSQNGSSKPSTSTTNPSTSTGNANGSSNSSSTGNKPSTGTSSSTNNSSTSGNTTTKPSTSSTGSSSSNTGNTSTSKPSTGNTGSTGSSTGNNNTSKNEPTTEASKTETHKHFWVEQYTTIHHDAVTHTETVCVQDAWDEPIRESRYVCNACNGVIGVTWQELQNHADNVHDGFTYRAERVVVGYIHHDAVYDTITVTDKQAYDEKVLTGYKCSTCGAME